jgi:hypothetical protein
MDRCLRPWFQCQCGRRCRFLYAPEWRCRYCSGLTYLSQHQTGGPVRVAYLRRRAGLDPRPFTPIPKKQRRHLRYHRLVAQIEAAEAQLIARFASISRDLERRAKSERWRRRLKSG